MLRAQKPLLSASKQTYRQHSEGDHGHGIQWVWSLDLVHDPWMSPSVPRRMYPLGHVLAPLQRSPDSFGTVLVSLQGLEVPDGSPN